MWSIFNLKIVPLQLELAVWECKLYVGTFAKTTMLQKVQAATFCSSMYCSQAQKGSGHAQRTPPSPHAPPFVRLQLELVADEEKLKKRQEKFGATEILFNPPHPCNHHI